MEYYLVTISITKNEFNNDFTKYYEVCANLKTAIKCAKHKAYIYDLKPLRNEIWEGATDNHLFKSYDKGYIAIDKYQMWEKEWD